MSELMFDALRRWPDIEAPNLFAFDATDRLLLDEAAPALRGADARAVDARAVVVVGDRYGALTLGAAAALDESRAGESPAAGTGWASAHGLPGIRTHQDALTGERALAANAAAAGFAGAYESLPLGQELLTGARVVLMQLPRSLAELDEAADAIARFAADDVVVYAGGRIKHLSLAMNEVLEKYFSELRATRARQKSRLLVASGIRRPSGPSPYPRLERNTELGLVIAAHGGAFSGTTLDIGTRYLLGFLDRIAGDATTAIDLGCGTGVLAASLAVRRPDVRVIATDQSAAAVLSAQATVAANGLDARVSVVRDVGLSVQASGSADVIVCNPPFHVGSAVHTGAASAMFRDAGRVLRPGGQLFTVTVSTRPR